MATTMAACNLEPEAIVLYACTAVCGCVQVGPTEHAICALSGGVDSTVAATLVHRVLGDRLHCVFVDHGLLRYKVGDAQAGWAYFMTMHCSTRHSSAAAGTQGS